MVARWVSVGSRTITQDAWRLRKAAAWVKLFALAPGHRLHREQVMEALWPELGRKAASNNLRNALHAARKVLDQAASSRYLASEEDSLILYPQDACYAPLASERAFSCRAISTSSLMFLTIGCGSMLAITTWNAWVGILGSEDLNVRYGMDLLCASGPGECFL
jgi:hypothetical protein